MWPACVWANEQTHSLNSSTHIAKPLLHKFSTRKQKLYTSPEVVFSCKPCPGYPKGWRTFKRASAEFPQLPLFFCYIFILLFITLACSEHQAELCTLQSWPHTWSAPTSPTQPPGLSGNLILCSVVSWSLVRSVAEPKSFTWIFSQPIKSDLNIL